MAVKASCSVNATLSRFLQQREPFIARQTHMNGRPVGLVRRTDRLADLRRAAQHKVGGNRSDAVRTTERRLRVDAFEVAELVPEALIGTQ